MKLIKTPGIVIRENEFSESDKIITLITPEYGKISVMAKGVKRKKKFLNSTELYTLSNFILFKGTKMYHLNEAEVVESFYDIRFSYEKTILATEILKKASYFADSIFDKRENYDFFKTTIASLYSIVEADDIKLKIIESIYIIKMLEIIGLGLNYEKIEEKEDIKNIKNIYIEDENYTLPINVYNMIKYIQKKDITKIFWISTNEENIKILNEFRKIYFNNHLM